MIMNNIEDKDEMDLIEFAKYILQLCKKLLTAYLNALTAGAWAFFLIILLAAGAAFSVRKFLLGSYKTEAILAIKNVGPALGNDIINNINKFKKDVSLQKLLSVSPEAASSVKNISLSYEPADDTVNPVSVVNVLLSIKDTAYIDQVQAGIINVFNRNEFINKIWNSKRKQLEEQKKDLETRRDEIDSVKHLIDRILTSKDLQPALYYFNPINPSTLFDAKLQTNNEISRLEASLEQGNIEIIQPFFKPERYNESDVDVIFWKIIVAAIPFALILAPVIGKKYSR
jgi:hypothetical protein